MEKERYDAIRRSLDLRTKASFLPIFLCQTAVLIGAVYFFLGFHSAVRYLAIPVVSLLMFRSFSLMHEAVHGLASQSSKLNNLLGIVSGGACLLSYESWKQAHLEHHRWSGNVDKDPVMAMLKVFPTFPKPLQRVLTWGWKCWIPTLSFLQHTVFWSITIRFTLKKPTSASGVLSIIIPVVSWIGLFWVLPRGAGFSIMLPAIAFYLIGTEIINAPHHVGLTLYRGETMIPIWNQFLIARTCIYPRWLSRFFVMNFNYHAEHHMFPNAPWYHLDKLHRIVSKEIGVDYNSDTQFAWVLRNRKKALSELFTARDVAAESPAKAA